MPHDSVNIAREVCLNFFRSGDNLTVNQNISNICVDPMGRLKQQLRLNLHQKFSRKI
jgi:hypothetical protein